MSDLTRRALEADQYMDRSPVTDWNKFDDARLILADDAPILARQVEAVEALADRLENEADYEASQRDSWAAECTRAEATRIRDALNTTD